MNHVLILLLGSVLLDALFLCLLAFVSIKDVLKRIIPNGAIIVLMILSLFNLGLVILSGFSWWIYPTGLLIGLPLIAFWNKGWLGAGDAKLVLVCGFFLGLFQGLLMLGLFSGLLLVIRIFCYFRQLNHKTKIALGPAISLAAACALMIKYLPLTF